ncbi:MAG: radical SAM protein [Candidatus Thiodiazotropha sp. (ex Dulcina madagascariensis)]|nr:radical SAM protein [Candidatus Thiodiazotropha sp. (ex Dulcina madagascariensis)]
MNQLPSPAFIDSQLHIFERNNKWIGYGIECGMVLTLTEAEALALKGYARGEPMAVIARDLSVSESFCEEIIHSVRDRIGKKKVYHRPFEDVSSLLLLVAEGCNMACTYCYGQYHRNDVSEKIMDEKTAIKALDVGYAAGARGVGFFGGEPLINFDVIEKVVGHAEKNGMDITWGITTNGTLVTEGIAKFCQDHDIAVSVGMDGMRHEHEKTRPLKTGRNSFDKVVGGVELLRDHGVLKALEFTYSANHKSDLRDMLKSMTKYCSNVTCTCVDGRRDAPFQEEIIAGDRLREYYREMIDLALDSDIAEEGLYLGGVVEAVWSLLMPVKVTNPCICSGVLKRASVTTNGDIYPCPEAVDEKYLFGNVWDPGIVERLNGRRKHVLETQLSASRVQPYWFSGLIEACLVRFEERGGRMVIDDPDTIGTCMEDVIYALTEADVDSLIDKWEATGRQGLLT